MQESDHETNDAEIFVEGDAGDLRVRPQTVPDERHHRDEQVEEDHRAFRLEDRRSESSTDRGTRVSSDSRRPTLRFSNAYLVSTVLRAWPPSASRNSALRRTRT